MVEFCSEGQAAGWEVRVRAGRATESQQAMATRPATVRPALGPGRARRIAWAPWLASLALLAAGGFFLLLSASTPTPPSFGFRGVDLIFASAFSTRPGGCLAGRMDLADQSWGDRLRVPAIP